MKFRESRLGKAVFARLYENEDVLETIASVVEQTRILNGFFTLIGTLKKAKMG